MTIATITATGGHVCESCRRAPAVLTWSWPGAGDPFLLCHGCAPADATDAVFGGER